MEFCACAISADTTVCRFCYVSCTTGLENQAPDSLSVWTTTQRDTEQFRHRACVGCFAVSINTYRDKRMREQMFLGTTTIII